MKRSIFYAAMLLLISAACRKDNSTELAAGEPGTQQALNKNLCAGEFEPCNNDFRAYCSAAGSNNETAIPYVEDPVFLKGNALHYNDVDNWYLWTSPPVPGYSTLTLRVRMSYDPANIEMPVYSVVLHPHYVIPPNLYSPVNRYSQVIRCNLNTNTAGVIAQDNPSPYIKIQSVEMSEGFLVIVIKATPQLEPDLWGKGLQLRIGNTSLDAAGMYWGNNVPGCYEIYYHWFSH